MQDIILHPEYNSSLILRTEVISEMEITQHITAPYVQKVKGFRPVRLLTRRILPRRPDRDSSIEQDCVFYTLESGPEMDNSISLVVLYPKLVDLNIPFYHPRVSALAFRYIQNNATPTSSKSIEYMHELVIEAIPLDSSDREAAAPTSRLYRTCCALAEMVWRVGHGKMSGYKKRVSHDVR